MKLALTLFICVFPCLAAVTEYTDPSQFTSALSQIPNTTVTADSFLSPDMSFNTGSTTTGSWSFCSGKDCSTVNPGEPLYTWANITFDKPVYGFGATISASSGPEQWNTNDSGFLNIDTPCGDSLCAYTGFFGFTDTTPFTQLQIGPEILDGHFNTSIQATMESPIVGYDPPAPSCPEPATYALMGAGMVGMALVYRRRKRA